MCNEVRSPRNVSRSYATEMGTRTTRRAEGAYEMFPMTRIPARIFNVFLRPAVPEHSPSPLKKLLGFGCGISERVNVELGNRYNLVLMIPRKLRVHCPMHLPETLVQDPGEKTHAGFPLRLLRSVLDVSCPFNWDPHTGLSRLMDNLGPRFQAIAPIEISVSHGFDYHDFPRYLVGLRVCHFRKY